MPNGRFPCPYEREDPEPAPGVFVANRRMEEVGRAYMAIAKVKGRAAASRFLRYQKGQEDTDAALWQFGHAVGTALNEGIPEEDVVSDLATWSDASSEPRRAAWWHNGGARMISEERNN